MATEIQVIHAGQSWYIDTPEGRIGPMESQKEANAYLALMRIAMVAGTEVACTEAECFT